MSGDGEKIDTGKKFIHEKIAENGGFKFKYVFVSSLVLLLLLSLISYNPFDTAVIEGGADASLTNWIGLAGAYISRILLYLFGVAAFPITLFLILCALRSFIAIPLHRKGYFGALIVVILGITMLFGLWPETFVAITEQMGLGSTRRPEFALSGGVIGQLLVAPPVPNLHIGAGFIRNIIGTVGSLVVALIFLFTGLFFVWMADWQSVLITFLNARKKHMEREKMSEEEKESEGGESKPGRSLEFLRKSKAKEAEDSPSKEEGSMLSGDEHESYSEKDDSMEIREEDSEKEKVYGNYPSPKRIQREDLPETKNSDVQLPRKSVTHHVPSDYQNDEYHLPPISLLKKYEIQYGESREVIERSKAILHATMESFKIDGEVTGVVTGPRVTRFEISLAPGIKVDKIVSIERNIAMELEAKSIRTLAPIPGKNAIGIEVPNSKPSPVYMRSVMESPAWKNSSHEIPIVLGKDVSGNPIVMDLARAPHLLIAGATGSGKSVCMNTVIISLLFKFSPSELRLILVDPKVVELEMYRELPHLITPVVNDPKKIPIALRWAVNEMERRYRILAKARVKNLKGFNSRPPQEDVLLDDEGNPIPKKMPYLIIIIDELADVMMTDAKTDVETSIARIAQKGRAAGIHIIIATQRPSTNIITGVIKANLPTRIAFKVGAIVDSRVILDQKGAETLLGKGDMLFVPPGASNLERIQGAMVDDTDIQKIADFVSDQVPQRFDTDITAIEDEQQDTTGEKEDFEETDIDDGVSAILKKYLQPGDDDLIRQALEIIITSRKASTSYLQRRMGIGYNRAADIIDKLEERNIVSPPLPGGSKREILIFDEIEQK